MTTIWIRAEMKANERRAPVAPGDAAKLIAAGYDVVVEESPARAIPTTAYAEAGCRVAAEGAWRDAPPDAFILAVKELPDDTYPLTRRHIHFGHMFKGQTGWREGLSRFREGGGALFDLEYLTDEHGRRQAAFGYWAGFAGAALALKQWALRGSGGLGPVSAYPGREALVADVRAALGGAEPSAIITGALGRCGRGAAAMFAAAGVEPTCWDMEETASGGPFPEILAHEIFLNAVLASPSCPVFVARDAPDDPARRLRVIADVSCDPHSAYNPIPIYHDTTTFTAPVIDIPGAGPSLSVIAIDHLPSLLPVEATEDYSAQLLAALMTLKDDETGTWARARAAYDGALARL